MNGLRSFNLGSTASSLGGSIGKLLGQGLEGLAQSKMQGLQQRQQAAAFEQLGIPPEQASAISMLPQETQMALLKNYQGQGQPQPQMQQQQIGQLLQQLQSPEVSGPYNPQYTGQRQPGYGGEQQQQLEQQMQQTQQKPSFFAQRVEKPGSELQKQKFSLAQQKQIENSNKPFNKELIEQTKIAREINNKAKQLLELESEDYGPDNFITRGIAGYAPSFANPYNKYNAIANEIAALKSQKTGRPSVFMTQLQQQSKPNTQMSKKDRVSLIESLIEQTEGQLALEEARDQIVNENENIEPPNLRSLALERSYKNNLPSVEEYPEGTVYELWDRKFILKNGEWKRVGGNK